MSNNSKNYKELIEASWGVLQLVISMPDEDGRINRLKKILIKIKNELDKDDK